MGTKRVIYGIPSFFCQFSKPTIFIAVYIIISASFMLQVFDFIRGYIGRTGLAILVGFLLIAPAAVFFICSTINSIAKKRFDFLMTTAVVFTLAIILILAWQIKNFAERIHLVEYVILGWFAVRDLAKTERVKGVIMACLFCAAVGIVDEIFQWVLPYRFFDLNDIVVNAVGGFWGTVLFLITREHKR